MKRGRAFLMIFGLVLVAVILVIGLFGGQVKGVFTGIGGSLGGIDAAPQEAFRAGPAQQMMKFDQHGETSQQGKWQLRLYR